MLVIGVIFLGFGVALLIISKMSKDSVHSYDSLIDSQLSLVRRYEGKPGFEEELKKARDTLRVWENAKQMASKWKRHRAFAFLFITCGLIMTSLSIHGIVTNYAPYDPMSEERRLEEEREEEWLERNLGNGQYDQYQQAIEDYANAKN